MATNFFSFVQPLVYRSKIAPNLFMRFQIATSAITETALFHSYQIEDGDRPDTIAHFYYGSAYYDWVVLLSNQIIDTASSWPLNASQFESYLTAKYGSTLATYGITSHYQVINNSDVITNVAYEALPPNLKKYWSAITTISGVTGYGRITDKLYLSTEAYAELEIDEQVYWEEITLYDAEFQLNEQKRVIKLIDAAYVPALERALRAVSNANV